jgi:hypothetical protein
MEMQHHLKQLRQKFRLYLLHRLNHLRRLARLHRVNHHIRRQ